jgi:hypothetical protein
VLVPPPTPTKGEAVSPEPPSRHNLQETAPPSCTSPHHARTSWHKGHVPQDAIRLHPSGHLCFLAESTPRKAIRDLTVPRVGAALGALLGVRKQECFQPRTASLENVKKARSSQRGYSLTSNCFTKPLPQSHDNLLRPPSPLQLEQHPLRRAQL